MSKLFLGLRIPANAGTKIICSAPTMSISVIYKIGLAAKVEQKLPKVTKVECKGHDLCLRLTFTDGDLKGKIFNVEANHVKDHSDVFEGQALEAKDTSSVTISIHDGLAEILANINKNNYMISFNMKTGQVKNDSFLNNGRISFNDTRGVKNGMDRTAEPRIGMVHPKGGYLMNIQILFDDNFSALVGKRRIYPVYAFVRQFFRDRSLGTTIDIVLKGISHVPGIYKANEPNLK